MSRVHESIGGRLRPAFDALLQAFEYAEDASTDRWEFAVAALFLHDLGFSDNDLRWLVRKNYVQHAREVTLDGDDGRQFRPTGDLSFCRRTCFVLTDAGVAKARALTASPADAASDQPCGNPPSLVKPIPEWDADARKLTLSGQIVKRFRWPAVNQEAILSAFEEDGWPERIDDPLSPQPEQDSKRRLSDTIKCLNRKQINHLIHFRGDGTGEGVVWELVEAEACRSAVE